MSDFSRRDLLLGIASAPLLSMLEPVSVGQSKPPSPQPRSQTSAAAVQLNVLFHGTFLFWERDQDVLAIAPRISGHIYKAGLWDMEGDIAASAAPIVLPLKSGEKALPLGNDCFIRMSKSENLIADPDSAAGHFSLSLPFPKKVVGLRCAPKEWVSFVDQNGQPKAGLQTGASLPLVIAFVYDLLPVAPGKQPAASNLHVLAEMQESSAGVHFNHINDLWANARGKKLDVKMLPRIPGDVPPDTEPAVPGVKSEEEKSWCERRGCSAPVAAGPGINPLLALAAFAPKPINCGALFLVR